MIESNLKNRGMKQNPKIAVICGGENIGSCATETGAVKDRAADLGAVDMVVSVTIKRRDTCLKESVSDGSLPRSEMGPVNDLSFDPGIRVIHQVFFPTNRLDEAIGNRCQWN